MSNIDYQNMYSCLTTLYVRVYSVLAITLYNILILDVIGQRSESCVPNSRMSVAIFRPGNIAFPTLYKEE